MAEAGDRFNHEVINEAAFDFFATGVSTKAIRNLLDQARHAQSQGYEGVTSDSFGSMEESEVNRIGWAISTRGEELSFTLGAAVRSIPIERAEEILTAIETRVELAGEPC